MQKFLRRLSSVLALIAATLVLDGCENGQHLLLIEVFSTEDVAQIEVDLISLDVARPPYTQAPERYTPARTPEGLRDDPIRVSVELEGPAMVMVHIRGQTSSGETLVATRCYGVDGILQDEVVLFPIAGVDADGDSFVADPNGVCREPTEDGGVRNCNALDFTCADDFAADCNDDPAPVDGSELTGADIYPGARTFCQNGIDEDCDGSDEPCADRDGDGFNGCPPVPVAGCDCNDDAPGINPRATEICGDGIDQDCDGVDAACDRDEDGFPACGAVPTANCDCDDADPTVYPGATETPLDECDGKDNNCNGLTDEVEACLDPNLDRDPAEACAREVLGTPEQAACDCNDCDPGIYGGPESRERCGNGIDDDCDLAVDEGCPDPAMDADGDGQAPPLDCDDTDPFAYSHAPGEPVHDLCGNGVAATCVPGEDRPCSEDLDGDGYVSPEECEGDPTRGPLVAETCNGVDDDCDGIIDEVSDMAMPPNTGCIEGSVVDFFADVFQHCGSCRGVCSNVRADRCVAGGCDCATDPSEGECAVGEQPACCGEGCVDLAQDVNNCGACGRRCGAQEVCSDGVCTCGGVTGPGASATGNPQACPEPAGQTEPLQRENESQQCCNDSCTDVTMDELNCGQCGLACGPNSSCQSEFCECDPATAAAEWVDCNMDRVMIGNDGCETNIKSDEANCGACAVSCGTEGTPETCAEGACTCGTEARVGGEVCRGSTPLCDGASGCVECITPADCPSAEPFCNASGICVECLAASDCNDGNECTTDACNSGVCANTSRTGTCMGGAGTCVSGSCCTGCNDSGTCRAGTAAADCGAGGAPCMTCSAPADRCASGACVQCTTNAHCDDGNECTTDTCSSGVCVNADRTGTCGGGSGTCVSGSCCTGCADSGTCRGGTSAAACGIGGVSCMTCAAPTDMCASGSCVECTANSHCDDGNPCTSDVCSSGACTNADRTGSCTTSGGMSGMCLAGSCCPGCIDSGACEMGSSTAACGSGGAACEACVGGEMCVGGACVECTGNADCDDGNDCTTDTCSGGTCSNAVRTGSCMDGAEAGMCDASGTCCTGCIDGAGACQGGATTSACGTAGGSCATCSTDATCEMGTCLCGGNGDECTDLMGDSCGGGGNRTCRCEGGTACSGSSGDVCMTGGCG